ncbi:MAG: HEPN domain-containing protein [Candidatus Eremiobacterota bacterium]
MEAEARWWLETAENDLDTARILLEAGKHANAAFHLQQATEKALKALLRELGERERTHSSVEVMVRLERLGVRFPDGFDTPLRKLDRCFIDTRYPNGVGGPPEMFYNRTIVEELMECCVRVMEFVRSKLN